MNVHNKLERLSPANKLDCLFQVRPGANPSVASETLRVQSANVRKTSLKNLGTNKHSSLIYRDKVKCFKALTP